MSRPTTALLADITAAEWDRILDPMHSSSLRRCIDASGLGVAEYGLLRLGVSERTMREYLAGRRYIPGVVRARALADYVRAKKRWQHTRWKANRRRKT